MSHPITDDALETLFFAARTYNSWSDAPISDDLLKRLWGLVCMPPTSANCSPVRIVFVRAPDAKAKLKECLMDGNIEKTMAAPVTAVIGHDMEFYEKLPELFPHTDARAWFLGNDPLIESTAFRNGTLQGAYLIMAARALGLDCGPMSGFDNDKVDAAFFAGTAVKSNFLCNLGYGTKDGLHARAPRMTFADACRVE